VFLIIFSDVRYNFPPSYSPEPGYVSRNDRLHAVSLLWIVVMLYHGNFDWRYVLPCLFLSSRGRRNDATHQVYCTAFRTNNCTGGCFDSLRNPTLNCTTNCTKIRLHFASAFFIAVLLLVRPYFFYRLHFASAFLSRYFY